MAPTIPLRGALAGRDRRDDDEQDHRDAERDAHGVRELFLSHALHIRRSPFASSRESRVVVTRFSRTGQTTTGMRPSPEDCDAQDTQLAALRNRPTSVWRPQSMRQIDPYVSPDVGNKLCGRSSVQTADRLPSAVPGRALRQ